MARRTRQETEHCDPVTLPGGLRARASGSPTAGVTDRTHEYGEPHVLQTRSGHDVLADKERLAEK